MMPAGPPPTTQQVVFNTSVFIGPWSSSLHDNNLDRNNGLSLRARVLVALHLNHKIIKLWRAIEQKLMRYPRGDADDISGRELLSLTAHDRAVSFFMRSNRLTVDESAPDNQRRRAGQHEKYIRLSFMPLHLAVAGSVHN